MRIFAGLLVFGATLLANPALSPSYRQNPAEPGVYKLQIAPAKPVQGEDCSPERRHMEREALNREYWIGRDADNNIVLLPHAGTRRKFVFDIYQEQADYFNKGEGVLACYEGRVGDRLPALECNIPIDPCQKAALREAAGKIR